MHFHRGQNDNHKTCLVAGRVGVNLLSNDYVSDLQLLTEIGQELFQHHRIYS